MILQISTQILLDAILQRYADEVARVNNTFKTTKETAEAVQSICKWLTNSNKPGLCLYGTTGTGKTALSRALFRFLREYPREVRSKYESESARIYEESRKRIAEIYPAWNSWLGHDERLAWMAENGEKSAQIQRINAEMDEELTRAGRPLVEALNGLPRPAQFYTAQEVANMASRDDWQGILPGLLSEQILFVDDLGVEPLRVFSRPCEVRPIEELIYRIYDERKPFVITTNLSLSDISKNYGERVADRLRELCAFIAFKSKSFRG